MLQCILVYLFFEGIKKFFINREEWKCSEHMMIEKTTDFPFFIKYPKFNNKIH